LAAQKLRIIGPYNPLFAADITKGILLHDKECQMPRVRDPSKWKRNLELANYLGVTKMTLWRWQHTEWLSFPQPSVINGIAYTNIDEVDAWMKARVVKRVQEQVA
jgi:predicted DNA-binding transcriptional regulator AlpA